MIGSTRRTAPATSDAQKTSPLEPEPKTRKTDVLQTPHKTPSDAHPASGAWQKPLFAPTPKAAPGSSKAGVQTTTIRLPTPNFFFCPPEPAAKVSSAPSAPSEVPLIAGIECTPFQKARAEHHAIGTLKSLVDTAPDYFRSLRASTSSAETFVWRARKPLYTSPSEVFFNEHTRGALPLLRRAHTVVVVQDGLAPALIVATVRSTRRPKQPHVTVESSGAKTPDIVTIGRITVDGESHAASQTGPRTRKRLLRIRDMPAADVFYFPTTPASRSHVTVEFKPTLEAALRAALLESSVREVLFPIKGRLRIHEIVLDAIAPLLRMFATRHYTTLVFWDEASMTCATLHPAGAATDSSPKQDNAPSGGQTPLPRLRNVPGGRRHDSMRNKRREDCRGHTPLCVLARRTSSAL
eukprot:PhM_4_TR14115/c4_g1_i5/m.42953